MERERLREPPLVSPQRGFEVSTGWDHQSPPPELPAEVVDGTRERYLEAFRRLTGTEPAL